MTRSEISYHTPNPQDLSGGGPSSLDKVPAGILVDLLGGARDAGDPSKRDFGERYSYIDVLGEGGQGVVVRARDNLLEREVAVKALKAPFDPTREKYLEREAKLGGILEHPNILPTYDLDYDETGSPFFVMKKIEGTSLEDMLHEKKDGKSAASKRISQRRMLDIFLQVCHAIEYAHSRGVYHLDLKPANVVIGPFSEVYVLDWGFAAKDDDEHKYIAGTPIYIAPERLQAKRPDVRSDVYSLGVMLYRILVGAYPRNVGKMSFREYRKSFRDIPVIPPRQQLPSIPKDLEAIILKAMADSPDERYPSVRAFANDIERFLDLMPVSAYRTSVFGRGWKFVCRHRRMTATLAILFLASLVVSFSVWRSRQATAAVEQYEKRIRLQAKARVPLEKAMDIVEQLRNTLQGSTEKRKRLEMLEPAIQLFNEAVALNPDDAEVYYQRGKAYYLGRNPALAIDDFKKAYTLDPSYIMAHYYAGTIYADEYKNHSAASGEFEMMKRWDEDNEFSELGQARIDLATGNYDLVLKRCERIEKLNQAIPDVHYIRGLVYQKSPIHMDTAKSLAAYDDYLKHRPDNPSAFLNRGDIRRSMGNFEAAVEDYRSALAINPEYMWALNNLGYVLYKYLDKPREGLACIDQVLAIFDRKPEAFSQEYKSQRLYAYLNRAAIFEFFKQDDDAEGDYRRAALLAPDEAVVHYRMGIFLFTRQRLDESAKFMNTAIRLSPKSSLPVWKHRRGIVSLAVKRYADAVRDFEDSIRLRTDDKIYPALMRWVAMQFGGGEPIDRKDFEKQLVAPEDSPWLAAVGSYYLGDAKAEEVLAVSDSPRAKCESYFYLGAYDYANGDKKAACDKFRKCLETGMHLNMEYTLAWIFLKDIEGGTPGTVQPKENHDE